MTNKNEEMIYDPIRELDKALSRYLSACMACECAIHSGEEAEKAENELNGAISEVYQVFTEDFEKTRARLHRNCGWPENYHEPVMDSEYLLHKCRFAILNCKYITRSGKDIENAEKAESDLLRVEHQLKLALSQEINRVLRSLHETVEHNHSKEEGKSSVI